MVPARAPERRAVVKGVGPDEGEAMEDILSAFGIWILEENL